MREPVELPGDRAGVSDLDQGRRRIRPSDSTACARPRRSRARHALPLVAIGGITLETALVGDRRRRRLGRRHLGSARRRSGRARPRVRCPSLGRERPDGPGTHAIIAPPVPGAALGRTTTQEGRSLMSLFATKSIETPDGRGGADRRAQPEAHARSRHLVTLGIGAIIGTGIFVLTGQAAAANTGPAIVLSMVLAGIASRSRASATRSSRRCSDRGHRVHLLVRDARRVRRVDHRLGPHPRVRARRGHGRDRLERLPHELPARLRRHRLPGSAVAVAGHGRSRRRAAT